MDLASPQGNHSTDNGGLALRSTTTPTSPNKTRRRRQCVTDPDHALKPLSRLRECGVRKELAVLDSWLLVVLLYPKQLRDGRTQPFRIARKAGIRNLNGIAPREVCKV